MMVNRYFGSKEQLFAEVVAASMADPVILTPENLASPTLCRDLARALVGLTGEGETPLDGFTILFRSVSNPTAASIARDKIAAIHLRAAQGVVLDKEHAAQRAGLLLSMVAGVQMMRQMIGLTALRDVDPSALVDLLTPVFEEILGDGARMSAP